MTEGEEVGERVCVPVGVTAALGVTVPVLLADAPCDAVPDPVKDGVGNAEAVAVKVGVIDEDAVTEIVPEGVLDTDGV